MSEILSDAGSNLFVFYIASVTCLYFALHHLHPGLKIGPDPGNSQPSNSPYQLKSFAICFRVGSYAKSKSGAPSCLLCLPGCKPPPKAPARTGAGRAARLVGHCRQRCIVSPGDLEDFPGETDDFLTVFFKPNSFQYKEIFFPSDKNKNDSEEECLQKGHV